MMITPVYAAILTVLFVTLSIRTLRLRRTLKIGIGTGDNESMLRAMRVHSNFAEYVPLALVLALMIELQSGANMIIHVVCSTLLIGRATHAYGVSQLKENYRFRVFGMAMTFTSLCIGALVLFGMSWGLV